MVFVHHSRLELGVDLIIHHSRYMVYSQLQSHKTLLGLSIETCAGAATSSRDNQYGRQLITLFHRSGYAHCAIHTTSIAQILEARRIDLNLWGAFFGHKLQFGQHLQFVVICQCFSPKSIEILRHGGRWLYLVNIETCRSCAEISLTFVGSPNSEAQESRALHRASVDLHRAIFDCHVALFVRSLHIL